VCLLCIGTLFLTLGVLALEGKLNHEDKGTPRELVRRRGTRADARRSPSALALATHALYARRRRWRSPFSGP
jgi:hypothetical protein